MVERPEIVGELTLLEGKNVIPVGIEVHKTVSSALTVLPRKLYVAFGQITLSAPAFAFVTEVSGIMTLISSKLSGHLFPPEIVHR